MWISAMAAVLSVAISIIALVQSNRAYERAMREDVRLEIRNYLGNDKAEFMEEGQLYPACGSLVTYWECILTNNGDRPVSIQSHDIDFGDTLSPYFRKIADRGAHTMKMESLRYPTSIQPGETVSVLLQIVLPVPGEVCAVVRQLLVKNVNVTTRELFGGLRQNGVDYLGNKVVRSLERWNENEFYSHERREIEKQFTVSFATSRGLKISRLVPDRE